MLKHINENGFNSEVLNNSKKVLVDFYADWCGPCQMLSPILEDIAETYDVYKVNVDENQELAYKYGIMSIPCVIVFENGQEKQRIIGLTDKDSLLEILDN